MAGRHVALIVRTEVRRRTRAVGNDASQALAYGLAGLMGALFGFAVIAGAYFAGGAIASGEFDAPLAAVAGVVAGVLALVAFVVGIRAIQQTAVPEHPEGLLLAARHRDVVVATLVVETLLPLAMVGIPGLLASLTFAAGAGSPASALSIAATLLLLVTLGSTAGFALGLAIRIAIARSPTLARYKSGIGVGLMFAYFAVIYGTDSGDVFAPVVRALSASPLAWLADLAMLAVVPGASPLRAAAAVGGTLLALVALGAATSRLAAWLWYSTSVDPYGDAEESSIASLPGVDRRTDVLVRKSWTRARRSPIRLLYVAYPILFAVGPIVSSFDGSVPVSAAPALAIYGAWATGAAFTLNPIGDETPVLPVTLTSSITGRRFVRALWLAGSVPGVPITLVFAVAAGVLAGLSPVDLVLVALLAVGTCALAPGLASGIGAAFPRVQPARITRSRRATVPSLVAFGAFSLALFVLSIPAWFAIDWGPRRAAAGVLGLAPSVVGVGSVVLAVALVALGAVASYRYGASRFDDYTIE